MKRSMNTPVILVLAAPVLLAGCGGASTSNSPVDVAASLEDIYDTIGFDFDADEPIQIDDVGYENVGATASFSGLVSLETASSGNVIFGEMTLSADFSNETLSGGGTNFGLYENQNAASLDNVTLIERLDGELVVSNGTTTESTSIAMSGDLDGTLTGDQLGTFVLDGTFSGQCLTSAPVGHQNGLSIGGSGSFA